MAPSLSGQCRLKGKHRTSRNARKHGLLSAHVLRIVNVLKSTLMANANANAKALDFDALAAAVPLNGTHAARIFTLRVRRREPGAQARKSNADSKVESTTG